MRLTFPNGEHSSVELDAGEVGIGSGAGNRVTVASAGLADTHARLLLDRKGLWMRVAEGVQGVHVNARPVRALALLRPGDLLCLGHLQVQVTGDAIEQPDTQPPAPAAESGDGSTAPTSACRVVVRGVAGDHFGRSHSLRTRLVMGASDEADIRLRDPSLSGLHLDLALRGEQVELHVRAGEGVLVNGMACTRAVLRHGDQISVDQHRFVLEAPGLARPAAAAANLGGDERVVSDADADVAAKRADPSLTVWWLIASAATLAAIITALLLYGPGMGS